MTNPDYTKIVFILDRSGSMCGRVSDVIGGFNGLIDRQLKEPGRADVSLILFDDQYELVFEDKPLPEVPKLDDTVYFTRGQTAYFDALGRTIPEVGAKLAKMEEKDRPGNVMVIVITDGKENASKEFSRMKGGKDRLREMITHQQDVYNWKFLFIGSDLSTEEEAQSIGIRPQGVLRYERGRESEALLGASRAVSCTRSSGDLDDSWKNSKDKEGSQGSNLTVIPPVLSSDGSDDPGLGFKMRDEKVEIQKPDLPKGDSSMSADL